jgi:hypothetical protein
VDRAVLAANHFYCDRWTGHALSSESTNLSGHGAKSPETIADERSAKGAQSCRLTVHRAVLANATHSSRLDLNELRGLPELGHRNECARREVDAHDLDPQLAELIAVPRIS